MSTTAVLPRTSASSPFTTLRVWGLHLISVGAPLYVLTFLTTGPHAWYTAAPWLALIPALMLIDHLSSPSLHEPVEQMAAWPFDATLLLLAAIQIANIVGMAHLMAHESLFTVDAFVAAILVGASSGYSAIVVAHELVHRRAQPMQQLGRLLMATAFYEHFSTEHVRGHHVRVGTDEDPATARYGETFGHFWRRTIPGQFRSAWRLETKRLGDPGMKWNDPRLLRSRVLQGVLFESLLAVLILIVAGPAAFVVFLAQAFVAVGLLEAVNYFEHYGLRRTGRKVRPVDSWDSETAFTLYALVGLSRHADHHAHAARPFQSLRLSDESPKLPEGYIVTALMAIFANRNLRTSLDAELQRRHMGPFATTLPEQLQQ